MPAEPRWITADELIAINTRQVPNAFVRDRGLIEGAAAAPINAFAYAGIRDLLVLAVRLLHAVAMAHAFEDGNKRTAFFGAAAFLELNGGVLAVADTEETAEWVVAMVERRIDQDELCRRLRPFVVLPE